VAKIKFKVFPAAEDRQVIRCVRTQPRPGAAESKLVHEWSEAADALQDRSESLARHALFVSSVFLRGTGEETARPARDNIVMTLANDEWNIASCFELDHLGEYK
jgi:hypothetical protein